MRRSFFDTKQLDGSYPNSPRLSPQSNDLTLSKADPHIVFRTAQNLVVRFGRTVPVPVEEVLSGNNVITARLSECGYAWAVCGRKLFVWQYFQKHFNFCFELQLPQSDLAHKADLASVFPNSSNSNHPGCVAVSPEGMVRYWPDISHEHISVDKSVDLQGQECHSLINIQGLGCVFVTTTCTVVLVQPKSGDYEYTLHCRTLGHSDSWFGDISSRVSSIFFGPIASDQASETKIIRLLGITEAHNTHIIYVLAGLNLDKWVVREKDKKEFSLELEIPLRDAFRVHVMRWDVYDPADIDVWILDIQPDGEDILILAAAVNLQVSPQVYYAMVSIQTETVTSPLQPKDFLLLKISNLYRENNPTEAFAYRFILSNAAAYVYNAKSVSIIKPQEDVDTLEFNHSRDYIFAGSMYVDRPVFFSRQDGLVAISNTSVDLSTVTSEPVIEEPTMIKASDLSLYALNPDEISATNKDVETQLSAAFVFYVKNKLPDCHEIINKLFPSDVPVTIGVDGLLDLAVINLSRDMLDATPASDPRWKEEGHWNPGLGSSNYVQIMYQLRGKQKAYNLFLDFLKETELWKRLGAVYVRESLIATVHILGEFSEKLAVSMALKDLEPSTLLDQAIYRTCQKFTFKKGTQLTWSDIFFRQVSRVQEILLWLAKICEEVSHAEVGPVEVAQTIRNANEIMLKVLNAAIERRQREEDSFFVNNAAKALNPEYLPWTASGGSEGLLDVLLLLHSLTANFGLNVIKEGALGVALLDDFVAITDIILHGRQAHIDSVKRGPRERLLQKQFRMDRKKLIQPLVHANALQQAITLAEKYVDFEIHFSVCDIWGDEDKFIEYMERYEDTNFFEHLCNWFVKERKLAKLFLNYNRLREKITERADRLEVFLATYPNLKWMQQMFCKNFTGASKTLLKLAEMETNSSMHQKTLLCLSKLAKLTTRTAPGTKYHLQKIDELLYAYHFYQEKIPDYVLQAHGYDTANRKVFNAKEQIFLYTCPEFVEATEYDFKKALDLAYYVDDEGEHVETILHIWRSALLRDDWDHGYSSTPEEYLSSTLFYRLIEVATVLGVETEQIPPMASLIDDESIKELNAKPHFRYLLNLCYEQLYNLQAIENESSEM